MVSVPQLFHLILKVMLYNIETNEQNKSGFLNKVHRLTISYFYIKKITATIYFLL